MKKLILVFLLSIVSVVSFAAVPLKEVSEIVEINDIPQKKIYDASKIWMAKSFKSSNSVIQYEDATTGTIIGKGNMNYPCQGAFNCLAHDGYLLLFTVKIDTKDNKARVTFSDLLIKVPSNSLMSSFDIDITSGTDKANVERKLKEIINTFQNSVKQNHADNDW